MILGHFFLDCDDDGHWYLIEAGRRQEWCAWIALPREDEASWSVPKYASRIDSFNRIVFKNPEVV